MPFSEKTASIGISFDVPNKKETIIIGSPEDVKRYYTTGILSENGMDFRKKRENPFHTKFHIDFSCR